MSCESDAGEQYFGFNGKEFDEGIGQYFYGFRMYDPSIGRFTGVDPIADQFAHLSVYNYASNDPIANIDLHGLQGVRYTEIDKNGVTSHNIELDVKVVTVDSWNRKANGRRPRDRVISSYSSSDVKEIENTLNYAYNGEKGTGRENSEGENVRFIFNVTEFNVGEGENVTIRDLKRASIAEGTKAGAGFTDQKTGEEILAISGVNFMLGVQPPNGDRGLNGAGITRIRGEDATNYTAVAHETGHQLLTRAAAGEHKLISPFGFRITPAVISAIQKNALNGNKK